MSTWRRPPVIQLPRAGPCEVRLEVLPAAAVELLIRRKPELAVGLVDDAVVAQRAEPEVEQPLDGVAIHGPG